MGSREYRPEEMTTRAMFAKNPWAILIDINLQDNPFRTLAENHPRGIVLDGPGGEHLKKILSGCCA